MTRRSFASSFAGRLRLLMPLVYLIPLSYALKPIFWDPVDLRFYNLFQSKRPVAPWTEVVVVGIDEETDEELWRGQGPPYSRHAESHAALIDILAGAGARAIAFDLTFERGVAGPSPSILADAMRRAGNVFLPLALREERSKTKGGEIIINRAILPEESLLLASNGAYAVDVRFDSDGRLRRYQPDNRLEGLKVERLPEKLAGARVEREFPIEFPSLENPIPVVSYLEVTRGRDAALAMVRNRVVFVGSTASHATDFVSVPRLQALPDGRKMRMLPGVVVLAAITENIIRKMPLRDAGWFAQLIWNALWCVMLITITPRRHPLLSALVLVGIILAALAVTGVLHVRFGIIFSAGFLGGTLLLCGVQTLIAANARNIKELCINEAENRRIRSEIETARQLQMAFLPAALPAVSGIDLWADNKGSIDVVSGDYYDIIHRSDAGSLVLAIADVSGKGIPASLVMSNVQAGLHCYLYQPAFDLIGAINTLNRLVCENTSEGRFVTFLLAELDVETSTLRYVRAGHEIPILVSKQGAIRRLDEGGLALGIMPDARFKATEVPLGPGDVICFFTDGVIDALNPHDENFGLDRLLAALIAARHSSSRDIGAAIHQALATFTKNTPQTDDITMIVLRMT
jgi:serine phosphatase RsbU (regulator of sigma subunit)/CHASE2 domain-containing sensor protein